MKYYVYPEDTFIKDVNRWSKKVPKLWQEIQAVTACMQEEGKVPAEYDPHFLTDKDLNYVGYFEFHLPDGKVDLLVIHTQNKKKRSFRLVRLGTHQELFHTELR